jgi:prolyl-tRNA synthetase
MSTLFLRTLRDDPADADVPSHRLLVRAGYVRRVAPGVYSWLPLGLAVLRNVERVVREEMVAIGAQEVLFPALIPREIFERSGRWADYGDALFRLTDRREADYLLAPTHEELFTLTVKSECSSHKDLPLSLFQIQTKYRDEARPRAGILRGREFVMKDSYSFDLDDAGLARSYRAHRDAYERIFTRLGLSYRIVSAVSGSMGGSASEEFLAPTPAGEDTFVECSSCEYAANIEAAEIAPPQATAGSHPAAQEVDTPGTPTIAALVEWLRTAPPFDSRRFSAGDTLKNLVVRTRAPGSTGWNVLVIGVPGDREVDLKRIAAQLEPTVVAVAEPEDLAHHPELVTGYIGPQLLASLDVPYLVDPMVTEGSAWVTGANRPGRHAVDVVRGRDFVPGPDGHPVVVTMGSYGVGVSRAVAAVAEQTLDDLGLCWPRSVAPADVHLVATGKGDGPFGAGDALVAKLEAGGLRVLYDDRRGVSPGVKFRDAELIGIPLIVVVGRGLADGVAEVRDRANGERRDVPLSAVAPTVVAQLRDDVAARTSPT